MAEICLDCWNKLNGTNDSESKYILSKEAGFCEECGEMKNIIIVEKKTYIYRKLRFVIFPFKLIYMIIKCVAMLPFAKRCEQKNKVKTKNTKTPSGKN